MLTQERLKQVLHYDPETGVWTWLRRPEGPARWNTRYAGTQAGTLNEVLGYIVISINKVRYYAHRLAVLYMTGEWSETVDHKEVGFEHRRDCRWASLRPATHTQNKGNIGLLSSNTSGYKGVSLHKATGRWRADCSVKDKQVHLGMYKTIEEAKAVYDAFFTRIHGEFARTE